MLLKRRNQDLKEKRLKVKGWTKGFHTNRNLGKNLSSRLISDKTDFKPLPVTKDKVGLSPIKRSI